MDRDACYHVSEEYVTAAEAAVYCGSMGARLASITLLDELNDMMLVLPTMDHWMGRVIG